MEEIRGERSPAGQEGTISALQMLREQLSIPRSVRVRGHLGRCAGRMKRVFLVPCLRGFVPATDKSVDSQGSCTLLYERFFSLQKALTEIQPNALSEFSILGQSLPPTKEGASQPKPLPTGPLPLREGYLFGNSGLLQGSTPILPHCSLCCVK